MAEPWQRRLSVTAKYSRPKARSVAKPSGSVPDPEAESNALVLGAGPQTTRNPSFGTPEVAL